MGSKSDTHEGRVSFLYYPVCESRNHVKLLRSGVKRVDSQTAYGRVRNAKQKLPGTVYLNTTEIQDWGRNGNRWVGRISGEGNLFQSARGVIPQDQSVYKGTELSRDKPNEEIQSIVPFQRRFYGRGLKCRRRGIDGIDGEVICRRISDLDCR